MTCSVTTYIFLGMSDIDGDSEFHWTDGNMMTWSWWYYTEPNNEFYGGTWTGYAYGDWRTTVGHIGLCEKTG